MGRKPDITERERVSILTMYYGGVSAEDIATELGRARTAVSATIRKHKDDPEYAHIRQAKKREMTDEAQARLDRLRDKYAKLAETYLDWAQECGETRESPKGTSASQIIVGAATATDKALLLGGKATTRAEIISEDMMTKLAELAGYERKG